MNKMELSEKWSEELSRYQGDLVRSREELRYVESDNVFGDADDVEGMLAREVLSLELSISVLGTLLAEIEEISGMEARDAFYVKWATRRSELMSKDRRLDERIQDELEITRQTAGLTDWEEVARCEAEKEEIFVELSMVYNVLNDVKDLVVG